VAVARALANRPGLILADEPTGSLDSANGETVLEMLGDLHQRGATVVIATHDPEVARRADRVIRMRDGEVVAGGDGRHTAKAPLELEAPLRMRWHEALISGLSTVARRPLRTSLTAAGVAIAVGVMSLILSLAVGLQAAVVNATRAQGQLQQVSVPQAPVDTPDRRPLTSTTLASMARLNHVQTAWGQVAMRGIFTAGDAAPDARTPSSALVSLPPVANGPSLASNLLLAGRPPTSDGASEVVISDEQARRLGWAAQGALGKKITFRCQNSGLAPAGPGPLPAAQQIPLSLTVVGVSRSAPLSNGLPGGSIPYQLSLRYWTQMAQANGWTGDQFQSLTLLADKPANADLVRQQAQNAGWSAQTLPDEQRALHGLLLYLGLALVGLAGIVLVVACLGIVNTMYTAVLERTREVGVLKALGARFHDVLLLFMAEAAVIGLSGGLAGMALAAVLAGLGNGAINQVARGQGVDLKLQLFQVGLPLLGLCLLLAVVVSTVGGLLPALRAARLDPLGALRYE
jgi:macrolide transport system ATP-binding/permease protein